jgi:NADH-quinone oxidoreductase subunit H
MSVSELLANPFVQILIALGGILGFVGLNGLVMVYVERKVAGFIQRRPGPYEVGPWGLLQPAVDAVKLVGKQLVTPPSGDRLLFWAAPLLAFAPVVVMFLPIPFGPVLTGMRLDLGLILILAFSGLSVLSLCLAGWGSNNKWSLIGAARSVAQSVAYEIPLLLSVLAVAMMTGSFNLYEITQAQGAWPWQWNAANPLALVAFFIFFVSALGETNRAPFDLPEAESELTAGFHTEYSGMGFGLFFLAEYASMIVICGVAVTLFLGGWNGPIKGGWWWFLAKLYALLLVMVWMRWTFPRVRFDQLLNLNWKWLMPMAIVNLLLVAAYVKIAG